MGVGTGGALFPQPSLPETLGDTSWASESPSRGSASFLTSVSVPPGPYPQCRGPGRALERSRQRPRSFSPRSLLILLVEMDYWERLLFETPHYVMSVAERAEDLRVLRENLLLVARDYNR